MRLPLHPPHSFKGGKRRPQNPACAISCSRRPCGFGTLGPPLNLGVTHLATEPTTHLAETDILVIGGGTAGPMAALKAKERNPSLSVVSAGKGQRQAQRRDQHGDGRAEQRRHPRPRDARAICSRDHPRQRWHRQPKADPDLRRTQLRHDPGTRPARGQIREGRDRRLPCAQGAPSRHLRAADARRPSRSRRCSIASCAAARSRSASASWRRAC